MGKNKEKEITEVVEERPEDVELQTTMNEDSIDVLTEDADVENENKEEEGE